MEVEDRVGIIRSPEKEFSPQIRSEFEILFNSGDQSLAYTKAMVGLSQSSVRSVCWKLFLGVFPRDRPVAEWLQLAEEQRKQYHELRERWIVDPHKHKDLDPNFNNPLSTNSESPWSKFFETAQLEKTIQQDLERLYPEHAFFHEEDVLEMMRRILLLWSSLHQDVSYRQGMHELLAPIVLALHRDRISTRGQLNLHIAASLMSAEYVEHDAFCLFTHLMVKMKDAFTVVKAVPGAAAVDPSKLSPVLRTCHRIHNILLKKKDLELYQHLQSLEIEPQLYALKWVRLLLGREFHLEDVMDLWDAILADGPSLALLEYICVAMLIYLREDLLQKNQVECLRRLMHYPPVEHVGMFVQRALQLRDPQWAAGQDPATNRNGSGTVVAAASSLAAKAASGVVSAIKGAGAWSADPLSASAYHQSSNNYSGISNSNSTVTPSRAGGSSMSKLSAKSAGLFDDENEKLARTPVSPAVGVPRSKIPDDLGTKMDAAIAALEEALIAADVQNDSAIQNAIALLKGDVRVHLWPKPNNPQSPTSPVESKAAEKSVIPVVAAPLDPLAANPLI